ncbi:MAG: hypothetical protein Q7S02_04500, partial [bacterium]|nr:hypothetical protein [bacterium]
GAPGGEISRTIRAKPVAPVNAPTPAPKPAAPSPLPRTPTEPTPVVVPQPTSAGVRCDPNIPRYSQLGCTE